MKNLQELKAGAKAKIITFEGGSALCRRLHHLGLREGAVITKITAASGRGPVVVKVAHTQIALGSGMASKIIVEPL